MTSQVGPHDWCIVTSRCADRQQRPLRFACPNVLPYPVPVAKAPKKTCCTSLLLQTGRATLYTEGLRSRADVDPAAQIRDLFAQLGDLLKKGGSDFDHLVKATYFASDQNSSRLFNDIRPEFFHPERPPAASKRLVKGVGMENRSVIMDMIATSP